MKVHALLQIEVGAGGTRQIPTKLVEAMMVDSALDTDTDSFSIDIGTPDLGLASLCLARDNEIRATIFTEISPRLDLQYLATGFADTASYSSDDQLLSIAGRDITSIATDSQAPPGEKKKVRPHIFIGDEAKSLGITKLQLASASEVSRFYRDGSESYWESWYRLYRKKKMYIWAEPDGTVIGDFLNYTGAPKYYFGEPGHNATRKSGWWAVERAEITSDKQGRIGEIWVFGERGDIGFVAKASNPKIQSWKKKPLKIMTSSDATGYNDAKAKALEEIFEGDVGALEIVLTVPLSESRSIIRQNNMAQINLPTAGISGEFFVVGCRLTGGLNGFTQQIRLREKNFAITRRVPDDPVLVQDPSSGGQVGAIGDILRGQGVRWPNSFAAAAKEFHDGWPYGYWLGVLLAICHHETGFRNVRGGGDIEWYAKPTSGASAVGSAIGGQTNDGLQLWRSRFANAQKNPLNPRYPSSECAVGPMQLVTPGYKVWADDYGGKRDEYEGGRWVPGANIRAGARAFASKLSGVDPSKTSNIWIGVSNYYGSTDPSANAAYRDAVKKIFEQHYSGLQDSITSGTGLPAGPTTNVTVPDDSGHNFTVKVPDAAPDRVKKAINYALRQRGKPYQSGAEGPNTFDCSGLMLAAYLFAGINLIRLTGGRTTYKYIASKNLTKVTKSETLPGDIIFFATGSDVHHCGMVLNDGHMIQAPHTGDVVKISAYNAGWYRDHFYGIRRVVDWGGRGISSGD